LFADLVKLSSHSIECYLDGLGLDRRKIGSAR
jgi:hypothetical protein